MTTKQLEDLHIRLVRLVETVARTVAGLTVGVVALTERVEALEAGRKRS